MEYAIQTRAIARSFGDVKAVDGIDLDIAKRELKPAILHSIFHVAATLEDCDIAEVLLGHGADISTRDNEGRTPLHFSMLHGRSATAQFLIERGADILAEDDFGKTPLDYAFEFEYVDEEMDPDSEESDE